MHLTHRIALKPTLAQADYFKKACGAARFVWNWALAESNRQYAAGERPNAMALKKQFNAIKYQQFPWLRAIHRDAHARPFDHLAQAWNRFFSDLKAGKDAHPPQFKKKGRGRDSFYVANDKFSVYGKMLRLPKIGAVKMTEALRLPGKIMSATVSCKADRWFVAIQVDVPDSVFYRQRSGDGVIGVDLGITTAATLSTGEAIPSPRPLKQALRRLRIRSRAVTRKLVAAKGALGLKPNQPLPRGTRLPVSRNRQKAADALARLHARISHIRADFVHKVTTRLRRENQAVAIEDVNVRGMLANERLARAIADVGFGLFRQCLAYKAERYGTQLVIANRWYPSSKLCSACGWKHAALTLQDRIWTCPTCGATHDRDVNAAKNLERLATEMNLPVASGKVTPVRYESAEGRSGQEFQRCSL